MADRDSFPRILLTQELLADDSLGDQLEIGWPPGRWKTEAFPVDGTLEATIQWLEFSLDPECGALLSPDEEYPDHINDCENLVIHFSIVHRIPRPVLLPETQDGSSVRQYFLDVRDALVRLADPDDKGSSDD